MLTYYVPDKKMSGDLGNKRGKHSGDE